MLSYLSYTFDFVVITLTFTVIIDWQDYQVRQDWFSSSLLNVTKASFWNHLKKCGTLKQICLDFVEKCPEKRTITTFKGSSEHAQFFCLTIYKSEWTIRPLAREQRSSENKVFSEGVTVTWKQREVRVNQSNKNNCKKNYRKKLLVKVVKNNAKKMEGKHKRSQNIF